MYTKNTIFMLIILDWFIYRIINYKSFTFTS